MRDQESGEVYFADIYASQSVTIEFQHSNIDPKEQASLKFINLLNETQ